MIKFPKMSIAASVVNRIMNVADEIERKKAVRVKPSTQPAPVVPDPSQAGAALDQKLEQPTPEMPPLSDPAAAAAVDGEVQGKTAFQGLVSPQQ